MPIQPLPCVTAFIDELNESLGQLSQNATLTRAQRVWLTIVLMGIVVTNTLCWAAFERLGLGRFTEGQLRSMFKTAGIAWSRLLQASVRVIISRYGLCSGVLAVDDTDKRRAKVTSKIDKTFKLKDKKSGGYFNGQSLVMLLLVTDKVTIPVDFRFYMPDPEVSAWAKKSKVQKEQGIPAKERDPRPPASAKYPKMTDLAVDMLESFAKSFPKFKIRAVLADALYGNASFMDRANAATRNAQVVSQLHSNQIVLSKGKEIPLNRYFARQEGSAAQLSIRGQPPRPVVMSAARLHVKSHGKKRFVVALRYEGETQYRYLVASDLSWRYTDIAQVFTLRWLIEVFFEDWKAHNGWDNLTKHQGEDGSTQGVILSLLCDHLLLLHPEQFARLKDKQPGLTAGCLIERLKVEAFIATVEEIVTSEDPREKLDWFAQALKQSLPTRSSKKHMAGLDLGRQEPTPSLCRRAAT